MAKVGYNEVEDFVFVGKRRKHMGRPDWAENENLESFIVAS